MHFEKRGYGAWTAYTQSKLCNVLFAKQLADNLEGTTVTAVSLHPGVIEVTITRSCSVTLPPVVVGGVLSVGMD
jgi:NAD(P)-dependent dehydrogenase (short-subunit alcohol dehydrogenase family)